MIDLNHNTNTTLQNYNKGNPDNQYNPSYPGYEIIYKTPYDCINKDLVLPEFSSICDELICPLCNGIVWNPIVCGCCHIPFGVKCLETWYSKQTESNCQCPNNCTFIKGDLSLLEIRLINRIQFNCPYKSKGCNEAVSYECFYSHIKTCKFAIYHCLNENCEFQSNIIQIEEHVKSCNSLSNGLCNSLKETCERCGLCLFRNDYKAHKENKDNICLYECVKMIEKLKVKNDMCTNRIKDLEQENQNLNQLINNFSFDENNQKVANDHKIDKIARIHMKNDKISSISSISNSLNSNISSNISSFNDIKKICEEKNKEEKEEKLNNFLKRKNCKHELEIENYINSNSLFSCNICLDLVDTRWGCKKCSIDICLNCYESGKKRLGLFCINNHPMKLHNCLSESSEKGNKQFKQLKEGLNCINCENTIKNINNTKNLQYFGCSQCKYNLCIYCYKEEYYKMSTPGDNCMIF